MATSTSSDTCYRHPSRETRVSCSNCGRPICPDCMTSTPVGMRCPECSRERTQVRTLSNVQAAVTLTPVIIALCVVTWLASGGLGGGPNELYARAGLYGPNIADGEWWRIVTGGFLHSVDPPTSFLHIGFNMYLLWMLGNLLEPSLGQVRFGLLYVVSLLAGAAGALIASPEAFTVGASGAVFGLMAAGFLFLRDRGIDPMASGIGPLILMNLVITFLPGFNISVGGHVGGLLGGAVAMTVLLQTAAGPRRALGIGILVGLAIGLAVVGVMVAEPGPLVVSS